MADVAITRGDDGVQISFDERDEWPLPLELTPTDAAAGEWIERAEAAEESTVAPNAYQLALSLHERLEQRGAGYLERCRVRHALARYLRDVVYPHTYRRRYLDMAQKLEDARPWGTWGVDPIEDRLVVEWANRAGLVKLCPDDAREESMRAAELYGERLDALLDVGYEVRFAVFTIPNSPRGFLAADIDAIFARLKREVLYARTDGRQARSFDDPKRRFPELAGAVATLEAPLSRHGDWNVHLNVVMAFKSRPDYKALRDAWGANVEFRTVPKGASGAAVRELVKYPLKAVSLKSEEKKGRGAPPVIEWPPAAFDEWWIAHTKLRRTRSWGVLYRGSLPPLVQRPRESVEWLGKVSVTPAGWRSTLPIPAESRDIDLILGNNFSERSAAGNRSPPS